VLCRVQRRPPWCLAAQLDQGTARRRHAGSPPGPLAIRAPWIVIGRSVFYKLTDLDAWIDSNAVPYGQVQFANRGRSTPDS